MAKFGYFDVGSLLSVVLLLGAVPCSLAWNDKGHMVVAHLAWRQLTEPQRAQVISILKKHPHWDEYLSAGKHDGFSDEEWACMRAGTWPDWVRNHQAREYSHSNWHYINYPVTFQRGRIDPSDALELVPSIEAG